MNNVNKTKRRRPLVTRPPEAAPPVEAPPIVEIDAAARFDVGQHIQHKLFGYRGLIFDVDATFQGSDEWYENVATSRPPRQEPWYHVLVDGADHTTYVAERNLEDDPSEDTIEHPLTENFFALEETEPGTWRYLPVARGN